LLRDRVSVARYTGDEANKLSTVGQCKMHCFKTFTIEKYLTLKPGLEVIQGDWK